LANTLLLSVQDAHIEFGKKVLFEHLSFNIHEGNKICLVGNNGTGKSTLMNIITGAKDLDLGTRWVLQGVKIGYLQQEIHPKPGQTVREFVFEGLEEENQEETQEYKVDLVIAPLELNPNDRMDALSGGQMRRAALARALVEDPDILLLDEPTNHLDLDVIEWLEGYLQSFPGALVCVSHDRAFLENISDKIFWLDRGKLRVSPRGFKYFEEWSTMLIEHEARELHNRQKVLDIELDWASRGVKARRKRNVRRLDKMKEERSKLKSDKNALARMLAKIEWTPGDADVSSQTVAEFFKVAKHFGNPEDETFKPILDKFSLRIMRGDRIGLLGKNGAGKTTFLRLLLGELKPDAGTVKRAREMRISYFDQRRKELNPDQTLWFTLCPNGGDYVDVMGKNRHVIGYLKDFLFDPMIATHPVSTLSGGQKNRLMLAKIMANPGGLLILDEPTNDLDMDTLDMLEEMLANYNGTLFVVSHDRDFLDQTVSKILAFEGDGKIEAVVGGYQDYLEMKNKRPLKEKEEAAAPKPRKKEIAEEEPKTERKGLSFTQEHELKGLPEKMNALEKEMRDCEEVLADPALFANNPKDFHKVLGRFQTAKKKLDEHEQRWLELEEIRASG
jgi:ATP-binding cassette subfamily F protein uup